MSQGRSQYCFGWTGECGSEKSAPCPRIRISITAALLLRNLNHCCIIASESQSLLHYCFGISIIAALLLRNLNHCWIIASESQSLLHQNQSPSPGSCRALCHGLRHGTVTALCHETVTAPCHGTASCRAPCHGTVRAHGAALHSASAVPCNRRGRHVLGIGL